MRIRALSTVALSVAALTACGSGAPAEDQAPAAPTDTTPAVECEAVPQEVLDRIGSGAQDGTGLQMVRAAAYRSPNYEQVYFVAGEFSATGGDNETGVWVTNSIDPAVSGLTMSVDGFAKNFTVWPDASKTDFAIPGAGEDVDNARACLDQMS